MDERLKDNPERETKLGSAAAPEDIRVGDYVAILYAIGEHLTCEMLESHAWRSTQPVRVRWLPPLLEDNLPAKVIDICLPFICVRDANGRYRMLDVRRYRLARLDGRFARNVRRRVRRRAEAERREADT
jgi:hypothetical protein